MVSSKGEVNHVKTTYSTMPTTTTGTLRQRQRWLLTLHMSQYLKDANKMERVCYNRMRAAELARDSVFALVPCQEMARDSGALGSCTGEARDSLVALGSAEWKSRVRVLCIKQVRRLVSENRVEK